MPELLLEFFSEEIPARMQRRACADLGRMMGARMTEAGLSYGTLETYATPRRLTLWAAGLPAATPDVVEERKGPRIDAPERAIEGFLRSAGIPKEDLEVREDAKGSIFFAKIHRPGRPATDVLAGMIEEVARNFPWPKSMRWGEGRLRWVRPLHSVLCIFGEPGDPAQITPVKLDDIPVGDTTRGHRFMAPGAFAVTDFLDYREKLAKAYVVLDAADRVTRIRSSMAQMANQKNLELLDDDGLLQEVSGLVEWPTPILGAVDPEYQDLPPEVLQTSMREHQKFFSLRDPDTHNISAFITVANIHATDTGERIQAGNERVLKARLADAKFFWNNDLGAPLDHMAARLESVVFHAKLGDQTDRISRVRGLAAEICDRLGAKAGLCDRAAELAKADLVSDMVYEFPELQGIMGRYYALAAGEPLEVADAIAGHYKPSGASDSIPRDETSIVVALADRIDMLTCFWVIDEKPTGSRDPFALRRAALGVIRIAMENNLFLPLRPLIEQHYFLAKRAQQNAYFSSRGEEGLIGRNLAIRVLDRLYEDDTQSARDAASLGRDPAWGDVVDAWRAESRQIADELLAFMGDRMAVYLREEEGLRHDVVQAVLENGLNDVASAGARVRALSVFLESADGVNLMAGYRRAANIVAAEEKKDGVMFGSIPDVTLLRGEEEAALLHALQDIEKAARSAFAQGQYEAALSFLARLRGPLDAFFEGVVVNAPDPNLRAARLQLLNRVRDALNMAADLSYLEG